MGEAGVFSTLGRTPGDRRRAVILVGSALLHVAVLGLLGLNSARLADPPIFLDDPIILEMEPRPLLRGETARVPSPARIRPNETRTLTRDLTDLATPPRLDENDDRPTPPAPRMATGAPGVAPPASANPWAFTPESQAAAIGRSMRTGTGGCRIMDGHLSAAEQALCDDRFNAGAAAAAARHPLGARTQTASEQRRNEQFAREGEAALRRYEARRAPLRPGPGIVLSSPECPGGNLSGSCAGAHLRPEFQHDEDRPFTRDPNRD